MFKQSSSAGSGLRNCARSGIFKTLNSRCKDRVKKSERDIHMKIIFFGTGKFGLKTLEKLIASDHDVVAIVTQPDKKKGRGWETRPTLIKSFLEGSGSKIEIYQPEKASDDSFIEKINKLSADVFVVVDYGQILSKQVLDIPKKYAINLHPSLLPKYRGATPINQTILNGDNVAGVTVINMTERMDAGEIILQDRVDIDEEMDAVKLSSELSVKGAGIILKVLDLIAAGNEVLTEQNEEEALYAKRLNKDYGEINWRESSYDICRKIKGLKPWPGTYTHIDGKRLKIIDAVISDFVPDKSVPGLLFFGEDLLICTGDGAISIKEVQLEGKKVVSQGEFVRGYSIKKGTVLGKK